MPRDWDAHYSNPANLDFTPAPLLVEVAGRLKPGRALDLACGPGRNALHLARLGWQVTAVDASTVAIRILQRHARGLALDARIADLERGDFPIAREGYELICDFSYLQRDLFRQIRQGITPGGVFCGSIHLLDERRPSSFALRPGELRAEFGDWKILFYSERPAPGRRRAASIVARKA